MGFFRSFISLLSIAAMVMVPVLSVMILILGISQQRRIKNEPIITVSATIVSKRTSTSGEVVGGQNTGAGMYGFTETECFATFQLKNGERKEFPISEKAFGLLVELDTGLLTYQDIRFVRFERNSV